MRQKNQYPIPKCEKHKRSMNVIGVDLGMWVYQCPKCIKESLKALWKDEVK